jgi:restriction system protein
MDEAYHFPPELLQLLVEAIPRLNRSKKDTLLFFRSAGMPDRLMADIATRLQDDASSITKFEIARTLLARLNEGGDPLLRARREVVKRLSEYEDFSHCWPNDQLAARGLVSQVQSIVNVKDAFTRMNLERQREHDQHRATRRAEIERQATARAKRDEIARALFGLFAESDASRRGKALEGVLNALFALDGMLVSEAFVVRGRCSEGVIEQIDGVVQFDGNLYLVEMKWWNTPLGPAEVAQHLVRVYNRAGVRGLFISYTDFTPAALDSCRLALHERVVTLAKLEEIVAVVQAGGSLAAMLRTKVAAATLHRQPYAPYTTP